MESSHTVELKVKDAQLKKGISKKDNRDYEMAVVKGETTPESGFKTPNEVEYVSFLRSGEERALPTIGQVIKIDIDKLEITKRAVKVTGARLFN
jgi:hypothetical protein